MARTLPEFASGDRTAAPRRTQRRGEFGKFAEDAARALLFRLRADEEPRHVHHVHHGQVEDLREIHEARITFSDARAVQAPP